MRPAITSNDDAVGEGGQSVAQPAALEVTEGLVLSKHGCSDLVHAKTARSGADAGLAVNEASWDGAEGLPALRGALKVLAAPKAGSSGSDAGRISLPLLPQTAAGSRPRSPFFPPQLPSSSFSSATATGATAAAAAVVDLRPLPSPVSPVSPKGVVAAFSGTGQETKSAAAVIYKPAKESGSNAGSGVDGNMKAKKGGGKGQKPRKQQQQQQPQQHQQDVDAGSAAQPSASSSAAASAPLPLSLVSPSFCSSSFSSNLRDLLLQEGVVGLTQASKSLMEAVLLPLIVLPSPAPAINTSSSLQQQQPAAGRQVRQLHSFVQRLPTTFLLAGPPGTGKTSLVKAMAKLSGRRLITVSPSDVLSKWTGDGERALRRVFEEARAACASAGASDSNSGSGSGSDSDSGGPSGPCGDADVGKKEEGGEHGAILFFDEIDAIAPSRGSSSSSSNADGGGQESSSDGSAGGSVEMGSRRLLAEFLILLNAVADDKKREGNAAVAASSSSASASTPSRPHCPFIIIAATNRIRDLDEALLRRFERKIDCPLPTECERAILLERLLQEFEEEEEEEEGQDDNDRDHHPPSKVLLSDEDWNELLQRTEGWSPSDIKLLVAEASMLPMREAIDAIFSLAPSTSSSSSSSSSSLLHHRPCALSLSAVGEKRKKPSDGKGEEQPAAGPLAKRGRRYSRSDGDGTGRSEWTAMIDIRPLSAGLRLSSAESASDTTAAATISTSAAPLCSGAKSNSSGPSSVLLRMAEQMRASMTALPQGQGLGSLRPIVMSDFLQAFALIKPSHSYVLPSSSSSSSSSLSSSTSSTSTSILLLSSSASHHQAAQPAPQQRAQLQMPQQKQQQHQQLPLQYDGGALYTSSRNSTSLISSLGSGGSSSSAAAASSSSSSSRSPPHLAGAVSPCFLEQQEGASFHHHHHHHALPLRQEQEEEEGQELQPAGFVMSMPGKGVDRQLEAAAGGSYLLPPFQHHQLPPQQHHALPAHIPPFFAVMHALPSVPPSTETMVVASEASSDGEAAEEAAPAFDYGVPADENSKRRDGSGRGGRGGEAAAKGQGGRVGGSREGEEEEAVFSEH